MSDPDPYYEQDGIKIYHGDCRDILPRLSFDTIVTDPPYGIRLTSNGVLFVGSDPIDGDENTDLVEWIAQEFSAAPMACFFSPYNVPSIKWRSVLAWNKGPHVGGGGDMYTCWKRDFELIGIKNNRPLSGKRDSAVLDFHSLVKKPSGHFCEKPVDLMRYLIWKMAEGIVVDPFMGSGTTLVAAKLEGFQCVGIEVEERYCETSANRLSQGVLF